MKIHLTALTAKTRPVFKRLSTHPALDSFVLVGGTAMALQLAHRFSEDLDFWSPSDRLSIYVIDSLMNELRNTGHEVSFTTPTSQITQFRINTGQDLRLFAQDWVVNGVKVQFFCPEDVAFTHFRNFEKIRPGKQSFSIMGLAGIFSMKAYVIHRQVRSRDLIDLWHFVQSGKTVEDIFQAAQQASPSISVDYAKAVLRGEVPLDRNDEGFELIQKSKGLTLAKVHDDFSTRIDEFEIELAQRLVEGRIKD